MKKIKIENGIPVLNSGERVHELKTVEPHFEKVWRKEKLFELRLGDREFTVGDILKLREIRNDYSSTGREIFGRILYILRSAIDYGLGEGFVILQIDPDTMSRHFSDKSIKKSLDIYHKTDSGEIFEDFFNGDLSFPVLPWIGFDNYEPGDSIALYEMNEMTIRTGRIITATINRIYDRNHVLKCNGRLLVLDQESIKCIYDPNQPDCTTGDKEVERDGYEPIETSVFMEGNQREVNLTGFSSDQFRISGRDILIDEPETIRNRKPTNLTIYISNEQKFDNLYDRGVDYPVYLSKINKCLLSKGDILKLQSGNRSVYGEIIQIFRLNKQRTLIVFNPQTLRKTIPGYDSLSLPVDTPDHILEEWETPPPEFIDSAGTEGIKRAYYYEKNELRWNQNVNYKDRVYLFLEDSFGHVAATIQERDNGKLQVSRVVPYECEPNERDQSNCPFEFTDIELAKRFAEWNASLTAQNEHVSNSFGRLYVNKSNKY